MLRVSRLLPACAALALLVAAAQPATPAPASKLAPAKAPAKLSQITVSAKGLHIDPGKQKNYLRFNGGVTVSGPDFALQADVVEMDVLSSSLGLKDVKVPQLTEPPERVIADPGSAVQKMVSEIRGPSAKFESSALSRVAASGHISVSAAGAELHTDTVFSTDGGQSWSTGGPASLALNGKDHAPQGSFSAGLISYNTTSQVLLARGSVHGEFQQAKQPPVTLDADELRGELKTGELTIHGGVKAASGTMTLVTANGVSAPSVRFNVKSHQLSIDGPFTMADSERDLHFSGASAQASLGGEPQTVSAGGPVHVTSGADDVDLTANRLDATLSPLKLTASGKVHLRYGGSVYDAEHAVVTRQGKKLIVDMHGQQNGRIDLDTLRQKQGAAKGKPPAQPPAKPH